MAEPKTVPNDGSVDEFLQSVDDKRRDDCYAILSLMQEVTGETPRMWGSSIIGFGRYQYKYKSGRVGESFLVGFSPRKQNLTLYIMSGFDQYEGVLAKLGNYKTGQACLYIKKLADVDRVTLRELVRQSAAHMAATNP